MFASALVNLALLKEETGDLAAAAQLLERASALRRAMFGPNSIPYADATFSLGRVLRAAAAAEAGSASGAAPAAARRGWFGGGGGGAAGKRQERWLALMAEGVRVLNESGEQVCMLFVRRSVHRMYAGALCVPSRLSETATRPPRRPRRHAHYRVGDDVCRCVARRGRSPSSVCRIPLPSTHPSWRPGSRARGREENGTLAALLSPQR